MTSQERIRLVADITAAFTPSAPVDNADLFAGRQGEIQRVLGAIFQRGQHAILYGERGVGKTSLANVIYDLLVISGRHEFQVARYNCGVSVDFEGIWRSCLKQLTATKGRDETVTLSQLLPDNPGPEDIREVLQQADAPSIIILDELDRISNQDTTAILADTIKTLSDHSVNTTMILVGVADSVGTLIGEHPSIERALIQTQMRRMSPDELTEIIDKGLHKCGMSIASEARRRIAIVSQGLPPYPHLLTRHAAFQAVNAGRTTISLEDLSEAIKEAVTNQQQTIIQAYNDATHSPRENLFKEVLLACALAPIDELGYFYAGALREPMLKITGKAYDIPAFSKHLNAFCQASRGPILEKRGERKRFRFRFVNPLMEPFVLLRGLSDGIIDGNQIWVSGEQSPQIEPF